MISQAALEEYLEEMNKTEIRNLKSELEHERRTCDIMLSGYEEFLNQPTRNGKNRIKLMWRIYSERYNDLTDMLDIIREWEYENE